MRVCVLLEALGLQRNRMCITLRTQPGNFVQGINLHHMPSAVSWLYGFQVALSICCAVYAMLCNAMQCKPFVQLHSSVWIAKRAAEAAHAYVCRHR